MQRNIRIQTKPNDGDKYVKIKIDQSFDFLEILSLKLTPTDVYRKFASNYGAIVGRVIANGGFGVPNAKVSVFIPIDDSEPNSIIRDLYPYKNTKDVNYEGVRYNLLPDDKQSNCHVPIGTFPNKRKLLDNDVWLEIYEKYYKFTTTTNFAGDYMIFGVPIGNQNMHLDVDVSDMEFISLKPYDLIEQGYNEKLFESRTIYKNGKDLGSLVQIQSKDYTLNVIPFWGDLEEGEVGINRVDFNIDLEIIPNAVFFGSAFTDSKKSTLRKTCGVRKGLGLNCDLSTGFGSVEMLRKVASNTNETEIIESESKSIDENGNWAFTVPMNLERVVTDEFGNLIPSEDPEIGIPTRAFVRFRITLEEHAGKLKNRTASYLVPNMYNRFEFGNDTPDFEFFEMRWKKVYTVTNYIPRYQKVTGSNTKLYTGIKNIGECQNTASFPFNRVSVAPTFFFGILCLIITLYALLVKFVNNLLEAVIFKVLIRFACFLKHIRPGRRGACRCRGCLELSNSLNIPETTDVIPQGWLTPSCTPCIECAACYDGGDDDAATTYSLRAAVTLYPSYVDPTDITQGTGATPSTTTNITVGAAAFRVTTDGSGNISSVIILDQDGYTDAPFPTVTIGTNDLGFGSVGYSFDVTLGDFVILSQDTNSLDGTYTPLAQGSNVIYGIGNGNDIQFSLTISGGIIDSITITDPGNGYAPYNDFLPNFENFTVQNVNIGNNPGASDKIFAFSVSAFNTTTMLYDQGGNPYPVNCDNVDLAEDCRNLCNDCQVTVFQLECDGTPFVSEIDWARCVNENIAEDSGIVKYHFYNDWVIGSLYSFLFDYKVKFKKKGKSTERFCDFDCRAPGVPAPGTNDPNYKHRKNRCKDAYIAEEYIFGEDSISGDCNEGEWKLVEIEEPENTDLSSAQGRGLIVEYNNNFYYSARHDVEINSAIKGDPILEGGNDLSVCEKYKLLFATNIIELGSMTSCDLDGEPYLVDRLDATSFQKDDGVGTLFDFFDCFTACPINRNGIQLMSQTGIDIAFAEISEPPPGGFYIGDDEETYELNPGGDETAIPDYDGNFGTIIFDRDDIILRRKLCENFNYYNTAGVYSSITHPSNLLTDSYLQEPAIAPDPPEILEFTIDSCQGFDNANLCNSYEDEKGYFPARRMHPYYTYFGIMQGQSSLDKLRKYYFDRCVD
jgi:hypothetical protein